MVIAAHPDDPEFGCAGTVVKWAQAGKQITYVLLTSGDKGSHDPDLRPGRLAAVRESEQRAAAAELGVEQVIFLRHPDGILENTLELRRQLTASSAQHRPHIVLTIDPWRHYQLHPDHRAAGQAGAGRGLRGPRVVHLPGAAGGGRGAVARQRGLPVLDRQAGLLGGHHLLYGKPASRH